MCDSLSHENHHYLRGRGEGGDREVKSCFSWSRRVTTLPAIKAQTVSQLPLSLTSKRFIISTKERFAADPVDPSQPRACSENLPHFYPRLRPVKKSATIQLSFFS